MSNLDLRLNDDKSSLIVEAKGPHIALSGAEVVTFLNALGEARQQMPTAEVSADPPLNQPLVGITDPKWFLNREPSEDGTILLLRHPAFGWLGFFLPISSVERLHKRLGGHVKRLKKRRSKMN